MRKQHGRTLANPRPAPDPEPVTDEISGFVIDPGVKKPDTVRLCNCVQCGDVMTGASHSDRKRSSDPFTSTADGLPVLAFTRIAGQPFCISCASPKPAPRPRNEPPQSALRAGDSSPWQENAIRALEEALSAQE